LRLDSTPLYVGEYPNVAGLPAQIGIERFLDSGIAFFLKIDGFGKRLDSWTMTLVLSLSVSANQNLPGLAN